MLRRTHTIILLVAFCVGSAVGVFLLVRAPANADKQVLKEAPNDQAFYAEGTTAMAAHSASSATHIAMPILVYHIVRPSYDSDSAAVRALAHTPEIFEAELQYLLAAGYHSVSFNDLENRLQYGTPLPSKPILLSFDDGWGDQYDYAFPILKKLQVTATFFVFTNSIGRRGFLTWDKLKEMRAAGMTIGSHSRTHPYLTSIDSSEALWSEIADSKKILEKHLGVTINEFAYPFGQYNAAIAAMVEKAGYRSARGDYVNGEHRADHLYELGALNAPTTLELFKKKLP
ncbi:MAG: polysaccharide deacetylase family protein [Candidatus Kaiserbacteria bacterium]|nr:polysaccharide deacetylase family protein [Candidatus Kaiserbacteria bacterium]